MCDNFVRYLNQKNVVAYQLNHATKENNFISVRSQQILTVNTENSISRVDNAIYLSAGGSRVLCVCAVFNIGIQQRPQPSYHSHYYSNYNINTTTWKCLLFEKCIFLPIIVQVPHLLRLLFNQSCRYSIRPSFYVHTLFGFILLFSLCVFVSQAASAHTANPGIEICNIPLSLCVFIAWECVQTFAVVIYTERKKNRLTNE